MEEHTLKKSQFVNTLKAISCGLLVMFCLIVFSAGCKKDRKPPEIGPIEMCVNDISSKPGTPECVCALTTGVPFQDESHLTYQNFRAVIMSTPGAQRHPILYCDKMIGFKPDYWFILQNWIHDLLTYIKNYCANLIE